MRRPSLLALLLMVITLAAYWPVRHAKFINFDDPVYVTNNEYVFRGVTWHGVVWAFTTIHGGNWHPLTWLSHMLDCQMFGDKAGWHHLMNVAFHAANAALLLLLLWRMTGAVWRSAFVAALFALHPLHVESVAWISERKDVLSTFFGLLTLCAYVRYVQGGKAHDSKFKVYYGLALLCFALGLMSKPMLVTIPFLMLLLDYWPLGRFQVGIQGPQRKTLPQLVREKLPFFGLAVLSSGVTYWAQKTGGAVVTMQRMSLGDRFANVSVAYLEYLGKTFWPSKLAAFYPFPPVLPETEAIVGFVVMAGVTVLALTLRQRVPYFAMGWLWFVGALVPVIGLVQVGSQAMADRYTYLPLVGLFVAITWAMADGTAGRRWQPWALALGAGSIVAACFIYTQIQARYWHSSITLFSRAIEVTGDNGLAQHNLGQALSTAGKQGEAIAHFNEALRISAGYPQAYFNRGNAYGLEGSINAAMADYREAIRYKPDYEQAYCNLGKALVLEGKLEEARTNFVEALRLKPDYAEVHTKLGNLLVLEGDLPAALEHLRAAVNYEPDYDEGQYYLAGALVRVRDFRGAATHLRAALKVRPGYPSALNDLGWLLATCEDAQVRNIAEAVRCATRACELTGQKDPVYLDTLAVAQSEAGQLSDAIAVTEKAIAKASAANNPGLAAELETHLKFYQAGHTYTQGVRDSNSPNGS